MSLAESRRRTKERFDRRNRLKTAKGRPRPFVQTPFGRTVTLDVFLEPLTKFLAGELDERPPKPPSDLGELVYRLEPVALALAALSPILASIYRRRLAKKKRGKKKTSARMLLCKQIGEELRDRLELERLLTSKLKADRKHGKAIRKATGRARKRLVGEYLKSDWTNEDCVRAGDWLMQCAMRCYFDKDKDGLPIIAPEFQEDIDRVREQMMWRDQVHMPHLSPPPDWTGPVIRYDDRLGAKFVRDWRPETQAAISEAFRGDFEHARGVNALRRVPLRIDEQMLALVKEFAVDVMDHAGEQRAADERTVKDDVYVARCLGNQPFWLDYNCDKRGRIYAVQHLHFGREDHVRALFNFAHDMPLRRPFPPVDAPFPVSLTDLDFLAIHCANCQGDADKEPWDGRIEWTNKNRKLIQEIAASPADTFNQWRGADKPFAYVAACRELAGAWRDPSNFITHLPIGFDGSCNGIQHLALLARDADAARRVNLTNSDKPQDFYGDVIAHVWAELEADSNEWAAWWRHRLEPLQPRKLRKLIKTPAGTFAYNVTDYGMVEQINEVCRDTFKGNEPRSAAAYYLAKKIRGACEELLPGPNRMMRYIHKLARFRTAEGDFLRWVSPTGFPVCNRYQKPNYKTAYLPGGIEHEVADGCLPIIREKKARNAAAPNFVHSLDAAHLIRTVNAAVSERIINVLCVHDAYCCLAPQAQRFNTIIRRELGVMHPYYDGLHRLRNWNINADVFPLPPYGDLNPLDIQHPDTYAEYSFS